MRNIERILEIIQSTVAQPLSVDYTCFKLITASLPLGRLSWSAYLPTKAASSGLQPLYWLYKTVCSFGSCTCVDHCFGKRRHWSASFHWTFCFRCYFIRLIIIIFFCTRFCCFIYSTFKFSSFILADLKYIESMSPMSQGYAQVHMVQQLQCSWGPNSGMIFCLVRRYCICCCCSIFGNLLHCSPRHL